MWPRIALDVERRVLVSQILGPGGIFLTRGAPGARTSL